MARAQLTFEQFYRRLIDWYVEEERTNPHSQIGQLSFYRDLTLRQAIDNAAFGRYVVGDLQYFSNHYRHFPKYIGAQEKVRDKLLTIQPALLKAKDFMELYSTVRKATKSVASGQLALLFYYDTTLRIGAISERRLEPPVVFLQRGALGGAQATGLPLTGYTEEKPYIKADAFFPLSNRFRDIKPMDIETLLCVKKRDIAAFTGIEQTSEQEEED